MEGRCICVSSTVCTSINQPQINLGSVNPSHWSSFFIFLYPSSLSFGTLLDLLGGVLGFGFVDVRLKEELAEEHEVAEIHERGPDDVLEV